MCWPPRAVPLQATLLLDFPLRSGQSTALQQQACRSPTIYFSPNFMLPSGPEESPHGQLQAPLPAEHGPPPKRASCFLPFSTARQVPLFLLGGTRGNLDSASNLSSFSAPICPHTPLHSTAAPSRAARCSSQARKPGCTRASEMLHVSPTPASSTSSPATLSSPGAADVEERW